MFTAIVDSVTKNANGLTMTLVYTLSDGQTSKQVTEANVSRAESILVIMQSAENYANGVLKQQEDIAAFDPKTIEGKTTQQVREVFVVTPKPPTQEQLDLQAWQAAHADWVQKKLAFDSGLTKTITQQDVDDAYALAKSLYKDEYVIYLGKVI